MIRTEVTNVCMYVYDRYKLKKIGLHVKIVSSKLYRG